VIGSKWLNVIKSSGWKPRKGQAGVRGVDRQADERKDKWCSVLTVLEIKLTDGRAVAHEPLKHISRHPVLVRRPPQHHSTEQRRLVAAELTPPSTDGRDPNEADRIVPCEDVLA